MPRPTGSHFEYATRTKANFSKFHENSSNPQLFQFKKDVGRKVVRKMVIDRFINSPRDAEANV